jgi:hypothetical protein
MDDEYQKECESLQGVENALRMKRKLVFEKNQEDLMHEDQCLQELTKQEKTLNQKIESVQQKQEDLEAAIKRHESRKKSVERLMKLQCTYKKIFDECEDQLFRTNKKLHDLKLQSEQRDEAHAYFMAQLFREVEDLQNKWYELRKKREKESGKRQRND